MLSQHIAGVVHSVQIPLGEDFGSLHPVSSTLCPGPFFLCWFLLVFFLCNRSWTWNNYILNYILNPMCHSSESSNTGSDLGNTPHGVQWLKLSWMQGHTNHHLQVLSFPISLFVTWRTFRANFTFWSILLPLLCSVNSTPFVFHVSRIPKNFQFIEGTSCSTAMMWNFF